MNLLENRIREIKQALTRKDLTRGSALLIAAIASDEMFGYWSSCSNGSDKVPKILKYIRRIRFEAALATACVDLIKGDLKIGVDFFLTHINGPEDLVFLLIHERNHLILRSLYPEVTPETGYPLAVFNFAEDCYINGISRRTIPSTLPERFYTNPRDLLLTASHTRIDWTRFRVKGFEGANPLEEAHAGLYSANQGLLQALGETLAITSLWGYERWMNLMAAWYEETREREATQREKLSGEGEKGKRSSDQRPEKIQVSGQKPEGASSEKSEEAGDEAVNSKPSQSPGADEVKPGEEDNPPQAQGRGLPGEWPDEDDESSGDEAGETSGSQEESVLDRLIREYVPLVDSPVKVFPDEPTYGEAGRSNHGLRQVRIPILTPDNPVVDLIRETSEEFDFLDRIDPFKPDVISHVLTLEKSRIFTR